MNIQEYPRYLPSKTPGQCPPLTKCKRYERPFWGEFKTLSQNLLSEIPANKLKV